LSKIAPRAVLKLFFGTAVPAANFVLLPGAADDPTRGTMKKVLVILAAVLVSSVVLSACGSHKSCPAYGKAVHQQGAKPA
jgi:hypothetical protein